MSQRQWARVVDGASGTVQLVPSGDVALLIDQRRGWFPSKNELVEGNARYEQGKLRFFDWRVAPAATLKKSDPRKRYRRAKRHRRALVRLRKLHRERKSRRAQKRLARRAS